MYRESLAVHLHVKYFRIHVLTQNRYSITIHLCIIAISGYIFTSFHFSLISKTNPSSIIYIRAKESAKSARSCKYILIC